MSEKEDKAIAKDLAKSVLLKEDESWTDFFKTIFYAFLIAISFRTFVLQPFSIPSESMLKNLMVGDFLMVSKFSYGYSKHSLPWSLPLIPGRIFASDVERGDVVVFRLPRDPSTYYIKRIVGVPGDKIQVKGGRLYLNDEKIPTKQLDDYVRTDEYGHEERFHRIQETMPNGKSYVTLDIRYMQGSMADDTDVYIVPEGHYFAMGDNRDNSQDSRWPSSSGVGYVPAENIIGKAQWITLSFDNKSALWEFWKWFPAERRERFFTKIN
ncbi:MAG: signal peptidase I [Kordiimonadaceae bacterium]|nr:signal peptidase I [Kordiimonadaceae bacterium]